MTYLRTPKLWLLSTAALIFGTHMSASAQTDPNYHTGAPTMVAAAPSLPSISPEQIARDVTSEFNPRTGQRELVAAPFDPFEEDPALAASLRLRSADGAIAIDGYPLQNGALVELDFYYNSPSDDPYGGRNYGEAAFVNGELAPVVKRDSRVLECSTRVENVVYDQVSYYGAGYPAGIYRPVRHYAGHSAFGFGFGNSYFGPGYGLFLSSRSGFGSSRFIGSRSRNRGFNGSRATRDRLNNSRRRVVNTDRHRDRDRDEERRTRRDRNSDSAAARNEERRHRRERNGESSGERNTEANRRRRNVRRLSDREVGERASRVQSYGVGRNQSEVRRNIRNSGVGSGVERQPRIGIAPNAARPSTNTTTQSQATTTETRRTRPQRANTRRNVDQGSSTTSTNRNESTRNQSRRSETRRDTSSSRSNTRSSSNRGSNSSSRSNSNSNRSSSREKRSAPRRRISPNDNKRQLNFFPKTAYGGRHIVTSHSVDCAREDKLTVFIPNERLDAARFDGLTLIALDAQGGEAPIYLPPNYIEGFRLAATGRVSPQIHTPGARGVAPQIVTPPSRSRIEAAPCPSGTSKQPDGTCLQNSSFGYPR